MKSKDFKGSGKRLLNLLKPHAFTIALIIVLATFSVGFSVAGPKILGNVDERAVPRRDQRADLGRDDPGRGGREA